MPRNTHSAHVSPTTKGGNKVKASAKKKAAAGPRSKVAEKNVQQETAYERLVQQVNENERKSAIQVISDSDLESRVAKKAKATPVKRKQTEVEKVAFHEDGNIMGLEVSNTV